jgi:hypothetical protein
MKRALACLIFVSAFWLPSPSWAEPPVRVDVLYMNHGPMQPVLEDMRRLFAVYGGKLQVTWHDFESEEGERFKAAKKIREHIPLRIWIDDRCPVELNGKKIEFSGFPTGSGPQFFQGTWRLTNLQEVLDQRLRKN